MIHASFHGNILREEATRRRPDRGAERQATWEEGKKQCNYCFKRDVAADPQALKCRLDEVYAYKGDPKDLCLFRPPCALDMAAFRGCVAVVPWCLSQGVNPITRMTCGPATVVTTESCFCFSMPHGPNTPRSTTPTQPTMAGPRPSPMRPSTASVETLLEWATNTGVNIDVNAQDDRKRRTPLAWAVYWYDSPEGVQALLNAGGDTTIPDRKGETPLDIALRRKRRVCAEIISRHIEKTSKPLVRLKLEST